MSTVYRGTHVVRCFKVLKWGAGPTTVNINKISEVIQGVFLIWHWISKFMKKLRIFYFQSVIWPPPKFLWNCSQNLLIVKRLDFVTLTGTRLTVIYRFVDQKHFLINISTFPNPRNSPYAQPYPSGQINLYALCTFSRFLFVMKICLKINRRIAKIICVI